MKVSLFLIGQSVDIKQLLKKYPDFKLREPLVIKPTNKEWIVILKFGVVIFWNMTKQKRENWLKRLSPFIRENLSTALGDEAEIKVDSGKTGVLKGSIHMNEPDNEKIAIASLVLGRSIALEHYENNVEEALTQFSPVMHSFEKEGSTKFGSRKLLKMLGKAMNFQHSIVSHITLLDKPALTWEDPQLDRFYEELSFEYELEDRYEILSKKLNLLFQHVEFIQNFLDTRRGLHLEWAIVILIVFEIIVFLGYELFQ